MSRRLYILALIPLAWALSSCGPGGSDPDGPPVVPADGIAGVVTRSDTGAPLAGALVQLTPEGPSRTTDAAGRFRYSGLTAGRWNGIRISRTACRARAVSFPSLGSSVRVALDWLGAGQVLGQVVDAEARPVSGARVELVGLAQSAATDASGRYTLYEAPAGLQSLRVGALGYAVQTNDVVVHDGGTVSLTVGLDRSSAPSALTGRVVDDATGTPLAGASVWVGTRLATSDADGRYAIYELHPGSYSLTASAVGYVPESLGDALSIVPGWNARDVRLRTVGGEAAR